MPVLREQPLKSCGNSGFLLAVQNMNALQGTFQYAANALAQKRREYPRGPYKTTGFVPCLGKATEQALVGIGKEIPCDWTHKQPQEPGRFAPMLPASIAGTNKARVSCVAT